MNEHPELRKGRCCLFVSSKDDNVGKELSAAWISQWICTTIVDSHACLQSSENIPWKVKAQEVRAVATSFQEERPTGSDEGREVVQWRHLQVPSTFETSVRRLTVYEDRTSCSHRRDCGDLLLGGLSYCIFFILGSYIPSP